MYDLPLSNPAEASQCVRVATNINELMGGQIGEDEIVVAADDIGNVLNVLC